MHGCGNVEIVFVYRFNNAIKVEQLTLRTRDMPRVIRYMSTDPDLESFDAVVHFSRLPAKFRPPLATYLVMRASIYEACGGEMLELSPSVQRAMAKFDRLLGSNQGWYFNPVVEYEMLFGNREGVKILANQVTGADGVADILVDDEVWNVTRQGAYVRAVHLATSSPKTSQSDSLAPCGYREMDGYVGGFLAQVLHGPRD